MSDRFQTRLAVQFPLEGWGSADDLAARHSFEHAMKQYFEQSDIGYVDGGDIGSGTMNVFLYVVSDEWSRVLDAIKQVLRVIDPGSYAVVARYDPGADDPVIVWPANFKGTFSIL